MTFIKSFLLTVLLIVGASCLVSMWLSKDTHWNWSNINTSAISFDKSFMFGTSGAAYQYLGAQNCPDSNWSVKNPETDAPHGSESGAACDFWRTLHNDIELMRQMKLKAFRFSFEWSNIEPQQGVFNKEAIKQYHFLFDMLNQNGITPFMTLHHFTLPAWFEQQGGFADEKNNQLFIDFCVMMVKEFGDKVTWWQTFNEPGIYISNSYMLGEWPPGIKNIEHAGHVLKNMLSLHVQLYTILKAIKPHIQIGFAHNISPIHPYRSWNMLERIIAYYANQMCHESVTEFFISGNFKFKIPFVANVTYTNADAPASFDYFGLNYYTSLLIRMHASLRRMFTIECRIDASKTYATKKCAYAQGLYDTILDVSKRITKPRNIPIYITENGIADAKDEHRATFIERSMFALHKAIEDGCDVRGYFYWSLLDNFEWAEGYSMKFGLYEVNFKTQERILRDGAQPYIDIVKKTYAGVW